ncbi:MAG TPA: MFS transporter [Candidatus Saccharimonadia bacterium]|nr:MFS transporter [Candidatus Saccharimonadia bacterium]
MSQTTTPIDPTLPWWKQLNNYHWFVFFVASAAWCFDCLDQQLFILARDNALKALDPTGDQAKLSGAAMAVFVAGWATGGLIFGAVGDRIGRAKTLALTVLIYSVFTGLSSLAANSFQFMIYRALTGLGVGGVFGLAVALVADSLPDGARAKALGTLQALSAVGNVTAGLCAMAVSGMDPNVSWKYLFWIGSVPAFLCIFIMIRLKEPEKWVAAKALSHTDKSKSMGSYMSLFGDARWRKPALFGMMLCVSAVIGLWGIGFFSNKLTAPAIAAALAEQKLPPEKLQAAKQWWAAANLIVQNVGAFFGMICFTKAASRFGRKPVFVIAFLAAMASTIFFYQCFKTTTDIWMSFVMGFCQLSLFAGFAIYLPELFPTRLRSTGTSFCYNVGRFIAASGPITLGVLASNLAKDAKAALPAIPEEAARKVAEAAAELAAFRSAGTWMSMIFVVGLVALMFLPETKGRPMPED